jgi:hypothetical protein
MLCYSEKVQGNRHVARRLEGFCQFSSNGQTSLWRSPVTNLASGFPEQKLAKGVAGFFFSPVIDSKMSIAFTWVYLIHDPFTGLYKIGRSDDPSKRLRDLSRQQTILAAPAEYRLIDAWLVPLETESALHIKFAEYNRRGEWFELSEGVVRSIEWSLMHYPRWPDKESAYLEHVRTERDKFLARLIEVEKESV